MAVSTVTTPSVVNDKIWNNPSYRETFFQVFILSLVIYYHKAKNKQGETGVQPLIFLVSLGLLFSIPALALILTGTPISFDFPEAEPI